MKVDYDGKQIFESSVKEEAGLQATWNEEFEVDFNTVASKPAACFVFTAFDKD